MEPTPLTETEKAYFDTIKQVTRSTRPADLRLFRMLLKDESRSPSGKPKEVAVIVQRVIQSKDAKTAGWQPLAVIVDEDIVDRLLDPLTGHGARLVGPDGLEGAA